MPAPSEEMPSSETFVFLFKIIILKNDSAHFAKRYTKEKKTKYVTTKNSPQKAAGTSKNGFVN
jgi:hypothetical protein